MDAGDSQPANDQLALIRALPKIWIGYVLCIATFIAEVIFVANHPDLTAGLTTGQFIVPPLPLFLLSFVSAVYWLVCVHKLHVVLSHVQGWQHPISPTRAAWFHLIPFYNLYWLYKWPVETSNFVNWGLRGVVIRPRSAGVMMLISYLFAVLLGPGGFALLFFSVSRLNNWVRRTLASPPPMAGE